MCGGESDVFVILQTTIFNKGIKTSLSFSDASGVMRIWRLPTLGTPSPNLQRYGTPIPISMEDIYLPASPAPWTYYGINKLWPKDRGDTRIKSLPASLGTRLLPGCLLLWRKCNYKLTAVSLSIQSALHIRLCTANIQGGPGVKGHMDIGRLWSMGGHSLAQASRTFLHFITS